MQDSLKKLTQGYTQFRQKYAEGSNSAMAELANGQQPETMVIACSDSRVDPAIILQADPGDIFEVRNVANIVPPPGQDDSAAAAIQYAVCHLKIKRLVIMGHSQCGGIQARLSQEALPNAENITPWVDNLTVDQPDMDPDMFAKAALQQSRQNCLSHPWLKQAVDNKQLTLELWFFEIKTGTISSYSEQKQQFEPVT